MHKRATVHTIQRTDRHFFPPEILTKEGYLFIYLFSKIAAIIDSKERQGTGSRIVHTGSQQNRPCVVFLVCNLILPEGMQDLFSPLFLSRRSDEMVQHFPGELLLNT